MENQNPPINPTPPIQNQPIQDSNISQSQAVQPAPSTPSEFFLSNKIILLVIAVLVLILAGGGTYLALNSKSKLPPIVSKEYPISTPSPTLTSVSTPAPDETANWKTYKNEKIGFQFDYPLKYSKLRNEDRSTGKFKDFNGVDEKRDVVFGEPLTLSFINDNDQIRLILNISKGKPGEKATLNDIANVSLVLLNEAARAKVQKEKINVEGAEGLQIKVEGFTLGAFFLYKDYVLDLTLVPSTPKAIHNEAEYQKIITSFKFNK